MEQADVTGAGGRAGGDSGEVTVPGPHGVALTLTVPAGWAVGDAAGIAAMLVRDATVSGFRTNVTVQVVTVPPAIEVGDVAAEAARRFAADHAAVDERGTHVSAGRVVRMVCADVGPGATRVAQLQAFVDGGVHGEPARRVVFTIAGTSLADDLAELGAELATIVRRAEMVVPGLP